MLTDAIVEQLSADMQQTFSKLSPCRLAFFSAGRPDFEGISYLLDDYFGGNIAINFVKTGYFGLDAYDVYVANVKRISEQP